IAFGAHDSAPLPLGTRSRNCDGPRCSGYCQLQIALPRPAAIASPQAWSVRTDTRRGAARSATLTGVRRSFMGLRLGPVEDLARLLEDLPLRAGQAVHALPGDLVEDAVGAAPHVDLLEEAVAVAADRGAFEGAVEARLQHGEGERGRHGADRGAQPLLEP